jgi:outer membrane protein OmpA-like peptidoglycan-associated protein
VTNGLFSFPTSNAGAEIERLRIEMEAGATADILRRSLKRTELRLASALQAFPDIERQRSSDADKREIRRARLLIEQSQREIRSYRGAVEAAPLERGALSDLGKPLEALATRLSSVGGIMAGLLGLPGAQAPAPGSEAAGLTATAERAATEADHVAALAVALTVPRAPTVTPRQRVQAWIQNNAIFFSTDDSFRSPGEAAVKIDELAQLIKADDGLIRIVGYTDERGSQSRNDSIAQRRAERVREELVKRGVPATRLLTMGRATGPDLSPDTGENSPNRRVQIEIGFIGEDGR